MLSPILSIFPQAAHHDVVRVQIYDPYIGEKIPGCENMELAFTNFDVSRAFL